MKICCLQTLLLLGAQLLLSGWALTAPTTSNNFFYHEFLNGNGKKESKWIYGHVRSVFYLASGHIFNINRCNMCSVSPYLILLYTSILPTVHFSGVKLHVDSAQPSVFAVRGGNATMPCRFWYEPELSSPREVRVKWSWLPAAGGHETDVLVAIGSRCRSFGEFRLLKGHMMNSWLFFSVISGCMTLFEYVLTHSMSVGQGPCAAQTGFPRRHCTCDDRTPVEWYRPLPLRGGGRTGGQELFSSSGVTRYNMSTYTDTMTSILWVVCFLANLYTLI